MKTIRFAVIIALLTAWTSIGNASSAQTELPPSLKHLADGHIEKSSISAKGTKIKWGRAQAIIDVSAKEVLAAIYDYKNYAEFLPDFRTSKVLSQRGPNAIVYLEALVIKKTYKVWVQESFRERAPSGQTRIIEGKMLKGNISRLDSRWEVTPLDEGHTLVAFQMLFDPNLPLPASLVSQQNERAAQRTIKALKEKRLDPKKTKS
jgi:ribosome-associated toxin RatA of RatAB toxin-antitoxin module